LKNISPLILSLMDCISLPTPQPPGNVAPVAEWLEAWGESIGADVEKQNVEPGKDNVIITLDFGPGQCLVFNSHMDVNSPNGQIWVNDPFSPVIIGDRLYGLGSADTKGSLVSMAYAMEKLAKKHTGIKGKIVLTAVMGEEAGGIGSLYLVKHGLKADGAVVGEPTQLEVAVAHKGTYIRKVCFKGRAAHSGSPHLGINAIIHASNFCVEYDRINFQLKEHPNIFLGPANASVTIINGGTRQNTIPENAEVVIDRRLIPGETSEDADRELDIVIANLKKKIPDLNIESVEVLVSTIPSQTQPQEKIVKIALEATKIVIGEERVPVGFSAGCDMSKLVTMAGIPTVILGPGSLKQAHSPDEFVEIAQVKQAALIYEQIQRSFLEGETI
jgi:acetylornithine deacetylase/succinyl-diaminopimelate desuccinylase family protein